MKASMQARMKEVQTSDKEANDKTRQDKTRQVHVHKRKPDASYCSASVFLIAKTAALRLNAAMHSAVLSQPLLVAYSTLCPKNCI